MSAEETLRDEVTKKSSGDDATSPKDAAKTESEENPSLQDIETSLWETELEIALLTKCDYGTIRNLAKCRPIPSELRAKVWQVWFFGIYLGFLTSFWAVLDLSGCTR